MKKRIFFLSILISLLIISFYIILFNNRHVNNSFNIIDATIIDLSDSNMDIFTSDHQLYTIQFNDYDYKIGDNIKIKYRGNFDSFKSLQDIDIIDISYEGEFDDIEQITNIIENMSLDEKIGQLLLARVPNKDEFKTINDYYIGGYILFDKDVDNLSRLDLQTYISKLNETSKIPLFIAIDEEGGKVSRLSSNKKIVDSPFKSPQELYNIGGYDEILMDANRKRNILSDLGINVNLAPVADVALDSNSYIYPRTFGKSYEETALYIKTIMKSQKDNISYVLKHFPGYGNNIDTHNQIATDYRDCKTIVSNDFIPFKAGIDSGAKMIMFSHNVVNCIDYLPVSLSRVAHNILIDKLNYHGISLTDDLSMQAIKNSEINQFYTKAVLAGNNILIVSDIDSAFLEIKAAVENKLISEILIDKLIYQSLKLKRDMHLIKNNNMGFY